MGILGQKGLGNGFPIGACLARGAAAALFAPGHHGSTFGGNPLACRVGCAVVEVMQQQHIPAQAAQLGAQLLGALRAAIGSHSSVKEIRGHGLMVGIEMRAPCAHLVQQALLEEKLLITVTRQTTIRLLPPLICTPQEIADIAGRIARVIRAQT